MDDNGKKILIWLGKLAVLTAAVYWFMTKGLTIPMNESVGLGASGASDSSSGGFGIEAPIYAGILIVFLASAIVRSIYERHVSKPKSETYKRFRDAR